MIRGMRTEHCPKTGGFHSLRGFVKWCVLGCFCIGILNGRSLFSMLPRYQAFVGRYVVGLFWSRVGTLVFVWCRQRMALVGMFCGRASFKRLGAQMQELSES